MKDFDPHLQMFIQDPCPIDVNRLWFLRWLLEHGDSDDGMIVSQPTGEFADLASIGPDLPSSEDLFAA